MFVLLTLAAICAPAQESEVNWLTFEEAVAKSNKEPKKLLIDIYTDWCGWCKRMDKTTYSNPEVIKVINNYYYPVKLNAEQQADIQFDDHTFSFVSEGRRGYHELAASLTNNKLSYPTTVFMTENHEIIQALPGYMDSEKAIPVFEYFGADHFRNMEWKTFLEKYESM